MPGKNVFDTDLEQFDAEVISASAERAILVDFWADWCPPCISLDPVLKRVVEEYEGRVQLAKVEVDEGENMKLAGRYGLRGFPTVVLFIDGKERGRFSGFKPAEQIRDFLADAGIEV